MREVFQPTGGESVCSVCLLELASRGLVSDMLGKRNYQASLSSTVDFRICKFWSDWSRRYGAIYQARQTSLDRDVALKLIAKEVSQDPLFVERFEREAKTLAKLSHPNIVTVYDFGYTSDGVGVSCNGVCRRNQFARGHHVAEHWARRCVGSSRNRLRGRSSTRIQSVIHRDIKPENILLSEDGSLKVVDFGFAKIVDDSIRTPTLTATRQVLGSLHYLARPEQLESPEQVDHRVDLYALGVILYELLTGELPLGRFESPSALYRGGNHQLDRVVLKALSRKPNARYQSAKEFGTEIRQLQSSNVAQPVMAESAHLPPPLPSEPNASPASIPFQVDFPFSYDTMCGFAEAVGLVYVKDRSLCIEFRTRDM